MNRRQRFRVMQRVGCVWTWLPAKFAEGSTQELETGKGCTEMAAHSPGVPQEARGQEQFPSWLLPPGPALFLHSEADRQVDEIQGWS